MRNIAVPSMRGTARGSAPKAIETVARISTASAMVTITLEKIDSPAIGRMNKNSSSTPAIIPVTTLANRTVANPPGAKLATL
jgi:hypothetical protein